MIIKIVHKNQGNYDMEIDDEDWDKIKHLNLTLNHQSNPNTKYCKSIVYINCEYIKTLHIHRIIMGLGDFKDDKRIINHIDGNGLNNKKSNLELSNPMHNSQSFRQVNRNTGHIYYEKERDKYRFMITINKVSHSKRFLTEEEAINYKNYYIKDLLN